MTISASDIKLLSTSAPNYDMILVPRCYASYDAIDFVTLNQKINFI